MNKLHILSIFLILPFVLACNIKEAGIGRKYSQINTKYTEIKQIISEEVDDTLYIYIRLPKNYNSSKKEYPVLYLLDGDISFNMAVSVVRYLQFGRDVPDLIIVAPAYGTLLNDNETNYRERDYTISKIDRFKDSGGAENYLRFLKNELIPLVDSSYRTDGMRIINGYSLGGLFAINALLKHSHIYDNYIVGSPYLEYDIEYLSDNFNNLSKFKNNKRLFISVGEHEDKNKYHIPIIKIKQKLESIDGLESHFSIFENGTHFTCPPEALAYGLKFIFNNNINKEQ